MEIAPYWAVQDAAAIGMAGLVQFVLSMVTAQEALCRLRVLRKAYAVAKPESRARLRKRAFGFALAAAMLVKSSAVLIAGDRVALNMVVVRTEGEAPGPVDQVLYTRYIFPIRALPVPLWVVAMSLAANDNVFSEVEDSRPQGFMPHPFSAPLYWLGASSASTAAIMIEFGGFMMFVIRRDGARLVPSIPHAMGLILATFCWLALIFWVLLRFKAVATRQKAINVAVLGALGGLGFAVGHLNGATATVVATDGDFTIGNDGLQPTTVMLGTVVACQLILAASQSALAAKVSGCDGLSDAILAEVSRRLAEAPSLEHARRAVAAELQRRSSQGARQVRNRVKPIDATWSDRTMASASSTVSAKSTTSSTSASLRMPTSTLMVRQDSLNQSMRTPSTSARRSRGPNEAAGDVSFNLRGGSTFSLAPPGSNSIITTLSNQREAGPGVVRQSSLSKIMRESFREGGGRNSERSSQVSFNIRSSDSSGEPALIAPVLLDLPEK